MSTSMSIIIPSYIDLNQQISRADLKFIAPTSQHRYQKRQSLIG